MQTHLENKKTNLIKMGFTCEKCGKIYELDHPVDKISWWSASKTAPVTDTCNNVDDTAYYNYLRTRTLRNYNLFKLQGKWYKVRGPLVEKFIQLDLVEEAIMGNIHYPRPTEITRQVDIFTTAEKLGLTPPLNSTQKNRAKTKAFIERIKK